MHQFLALNSEPAQPAASHTSAERMDPPTGRLLSNWDSATLFQGRQRINIQHGESVYQLRITALNKLILTK